LYSSQVQGDSLGSPYQHQNLDLIHTSIAQIISELKQVSSCVTSLIEADEQYIGTIDQIFECLETMDIHIRALENISLSAGEN
jgi:hypothetical protein